MFVMEQNRIDNEQNAMRVLELMIQYQNRTERNGFDDGLSWTIDMISAQLNIVDINEAQNAIELLSKRGLVERRGRGWFYTEDGLNTFRDELKALSISAGKEDIEFRNEALTGIDRNGRRSKLTWAALPKSSINHGSNNRVEEDTLKECIRMSLIRSIAAKLGKTIDETMNAIEIGQIKTCAKCGEYAWHYRHNGTNGKKFQSSCVNCIKKARKK